MKTSYCHFKEKKLTVTCCYEFNFEKGKLKYGATIFRKENDRESWNRKDHSATALKRLNENPVVVTWGPRESGHIKKMGFYNYRRLENILRKRLIPELGCEHKEGTECPLEQLQEHKDFIYNPELMQCERETLPETYYVHSNDDDEGVSMTRMVLLIGVCSFLLSQFLMLTNH